LRGPAFARRIPFADDARWRVGRALNTCNGPMDTAGFNVSIQSARPRDVFAGDVTVDPSPDSIRLTALSAMPARAASVI
jgi:hypothetical protein